MFTKQTIFNPHLNKQIQPIKIKITNLKYTKKKFYKNNFKYTPNFKNFILTTTIYK